MNDPIPSAVQEVVDLFVSELASLKFGDLEPSALTTACDEVNTLAADVTRTERELESARAKLAEKKDELVQKAQRALAYARVYAENRPELASRLERIALPRSLRRTGRSESTLFDTEMNGASDATTPPARRRTRRHGDANVTPDEDVRSSAAAATG